MKHRNEWRKCVTPLSEEEGEQKEGRGAKVEIDRRMDASGEL